MPTKKPHILVILGTARQGRQSEAVAKYVTKTLTKKYKSAKFQLVDVKDYVHNRTIPDWADPRKQTAKWRRLAKKADGYILVVPEYNRGYPGELKQVLDMAYTTEYGHKPAVICSTSTGSHGGASVEMNILPVLRIIGMVVLRDKMAFGKIGELFKKTPKEIDKEMKERVEKTGGMLLKYAKALAKLR